MNKVFYSGLAVLVLAFFTVPAWARQAGQGRSGAHHSTTGTHGKRGSHTATHSSRAGTRSNKGGTVRGLERAEQVQKMNATADAKRGFTVAPGLENAEAKTSTKATASSTGSSHGKGKSNKSGKGKNPDESKD